MEFSDPRSSMNILNFFQLQYKWLKIWGSLPVSSWVRGAYYYKAGNFKKALVCYRSGLSKYPHHEASNCARIDMAYCMFKLGLIKEAKQALEYVIDFVPQSKEASLRLARLQIWLGDYFEAAWIMREVLKASPYEPEIVATMVLATLENGGPTFLLEEALSAMQKLSGKTRSHPKLEVAKAYLEIKKGNYEKGRSILISNVNRKKVPIEGHIYLAELLIKERRIALARRQLKQALATDPRNPRVLSLLAETYLQPGPFFNPEYARQLATSASQNTNWLSQREMHVLAQAYYQLGDKMAALVIASKAKHVGQDRPSAYQASQDLDRFITRLSEGTLS